MKRLLFLMLPWVVLTGCAKLLVDEEPDNPEDKGPTNLEVTVDKAGTLSDVLGERALKINTLKIRGEINGDDMALLRAMAGNDEYLQDTEGILAHLDLSDTRFVSGGIYIRAENGNWSAKDNQVPDYMWYKCKQITEVILPDRLTAIGTCAFRECESLTKVNIPSDVRKIGPMAFYKCSMLCSPLVIPKEVTTIDVGTFYECSLISDIKFPSTLTEVKDYAFFGCKELSRVPEHPQLKSFGQYSFAYCPVVSFNLPSAMDSIPKGAFYHCKNLQNVDLSRIRRIGPHAFCRTAFQGTIELPKTLEFVGEAAFAGTNVEEVVINSDILTDYKFGDNAEFYNCRTLKTVSVAEGVTMLELRFSSCGALATVLLPSTLENIGSKINDIEARGSYMFSYCDGLKSIAFPQSLRYIAPGVFHKTSLVSVTLPDGIETIDSYVFVDCEFLQNIIIPSSVKTLGMKCFGNCMIIKDVYVGHHTPPSGAEDDIFSGIPLSHATLHVPAGCIAVYKETVPWNAFGNICDN